MGSNQCSLVSVGSVAALLEWSATARSAKELFDEYMTSMTGIVVLDVENMLGPNTNPISASSDMFYWEGRYRRGRAPYGILEWDTPFHEPALHPNERTAGFVGKNWTKTGARGWTGLFKLDYGDYAIIFKYLADEAPISGQNQIGVGYASRDSKLDLDLYNSIKMRPFYFHAGSNSEIGIDVFASLTNEARSAGSNGLDILRVQVFEAGIF